AGVEWVQIDEPYLATSFEKKEIALFEKVYQSFQEAVPNLKIELQTYFESLDYYEEVVNLPVAAIGIDFVHDHGDSLQALKTYGFPQDKYLAAGVIDGRNVWRSDLDAKLALLTDIAHYIAKDKLIVQPSNSLLHVPVTKLSEPDLDEVILGGLSFADQKLDEIVILTKALTEGVESVAKELEEARKAVKALNESS
ncbi:5-methyltetrahydropteroyltriglutamate--homocysteine S-methyltransferase, partial [Listeria booriae]|nr:5-methyltetrahydropteroyltriglutamate--homocysteine S-methyltransferase [Listeria booriae]